MVQAEEMLRFPDISATGKCPRGSIVLYSSSDEIGLFTRLSFECAIIIPLLAIAQLSPPHSELVSGPEVDR